MKYKRYLEGKTDYKKRINLLKSQKLRLIIHKSLKNISLQLIQYEQNGDKVLTSAHTKELTKYNWPSKRNLPSAYLTGLLLAKKAKEKNIKEAILDLGLQKSVKGNIIYAALKGAIDGGLKIPHDAKMFPPEDRLIGKHTKNENQDLFNEIKTKLEK